MKETEKFSRPRVGAVIDKAPGLESWCVPGKVG